MEQKPIHDEIKKLTQYARRSWGANNVGTKSPDTEMLIAKHKAEVAAVCDEMDLLACKALVAPVWYSEFEPLWEKLKSINVGETVWDLHAIRDAFTAAGKLGPMPK